MSGKVLVADPAFVLPVVQELLDGTGIAAERATPPWSGEDVVALLAGPDYSVKADDFSRLPNLRVVATPSVGFDHVDLRAAARHGVWVCNLPDYCVEEMADSALALLLATLRAIVPLDRSVRQGHWYDTPYRPLRRVAGTRLGVIGFGRIGRALARRAPALGFDVWACDAAVPDEEVAAAGVRPAALAELLRSCEAFSLHVPLTEETRGLIGEAELAAMPRGSVLVNTARGGLVDHDALVRALESGHLGGAALDVLPVEPPTAEAPAPQAETLVVTPHALWYSPEAEAAAYRLPVLAVRAVLDGTVPDGVVVAPAR